MVAADIDFVKLFDGQVQFTVPRWQRKYQWGPDQIERLVEDIVAVGALPEGADHYAGNVLTFPDPEPAGCHPVSRMRVVDGQQRLVTVSILLAAVAEELGTDGAWRAWNQKSILDGYIQNQGSVGDRTLKLRLQGADANAYEQALNGNTSGSGAVSEACRLARRLVRTAGHGPLLAGLFRLKVLSVTLHASEDPQQVFESLNGTGRLLTEGEKVKNWLFMGLPETQQEELHAGPWTTVLKNVNAPNEEKGPLDRFLRSVLQRQTGSTAGAASIYQRLRRYALSQGISTNRTPVLSEIERFSRYAGALAGTVDLKLGREVNRELRHLREMEVTAPDALVLRILEDGDPKVGPDRNSTEETAEALGIVSTWVTRLWLSGRSMAGINRASAAYASEGGPEGPPRSPAELREYITGLSSTGQGVPDDEVVHAGLRGNRKAYGGTSSACARAVLLALVERQQPGEAPSGEGITLEHIMPQRLTPEWEEDLGQDWKTIHDKWCNLLPNLTLVGGPKQPTLSNDRFAKKSTLFAESGICLTKELAEFSSWSEADLEARASTLLKRICEVWPWSSVPTTVPTPDPMVWTLAGQRFRSKTARDLMVDVVAALETESPGTVARYARADAEARGGKNVRLAVTRKRLVESWSRNLKPGHYKTHADGLVPLRELQQRRQGPSPQRDSRNRRHFLGFRRHRTVHKPPVGVGSPAPRGEPAGPRVKARQDGAPWANLLRESEPGTAAPPPQPAADHAVI